MAAGPPHPIAAAPARRVRPQDQEHRYMALRMEHALEAFANGNFVVVQDSESRENEGDLIAAAEDVREEFVQIALYVVPNTYLCHCR